MTKEEILARAWYESLESPSIVRAVYYHPGPWTFTPVPDSAMWEVLDAQSLHVALVDSADMAAYICHVGPSGDE